MSDAIFLVGLEGERKLLEVIHRALRAPAWPLALGRKSFVPSWSVYLPNAILDKSLSNALETWPLLSAKREEDGIRRFVLEDATEGAMRLDQPVSPFAERRFGPRFVKTLTLTVGKHACT